MRCKADDYTGIPPDWQRRYSSSSSLQVSEGPAARTGSPCVGSGQTQVGSVPGKAQSHLGDCHQVRSLCQAPSAASAVA